MQQLQTIELLVFGVSNPRDWRRGWGAHYVNTQSSSAMTLLMLPPPRYVTQKHGTCTLHVQCEKLDAAQDGAAPAQDLDANNRTGDTTGH